MSASPRVGPRVRNRVGWRHRVARLGGSPVHLDLRAFDAPLDEIFAAMWLMPLMIAWGLVDRHLRKRPRRRADPYR